MGREGHSRTRSPGCVQRLGYGDGDGLGRRRSPLSLPQPPRTPGHRLSPGIRCPQEDCQDRPLRLGDPMWLLPEQNVGRSRHPLDLATEGDKVQVGFENLCFGPSRLDGPGQPHLPPFLTQGPRSPATAKMWIYVAGELHGDRAGTAGRTAREPPEPSGNERPAIHTAMPVKTPVLGGDDRGPQGRRDLAQGRPLEPPAIGIHPLLVDDLTRAIQEPEIRGAKRRTHLPEGGNRGDGRPEG